MSHHISTNYLTPKQAKYIALRTKGLTKEEAKNLSGYSEDTSTSMVEKSDKMKNALCHAMEKVGLTDGYIAKKLMQGTKAFDKHFFTFEGKVTDTKKTHDFAVREKYLRTILELQGYIKQSSDVNLNLGVIALPNQKVQDEWNTVEEAQIESANAVENDDINKT